MRASLVYLVCAKRFGRGRLCRYYGCVVWVSNEVALFESVGAKCGTDRPR